MSRRTGRDGIKNNGRGLREKESAEHGIQEVKGIRDLFGKRMTTGEHRRSEMKRRGQVDKTLW